MLKQTSFHEIYLYARPHVSLVQQHPFFEPHEISVKKKKRCAKAINNLLRPTLTGILLQENSTSC